MKTTKAIAIALILGIASLGYAQVEGPADQTPNTTPQSIVINLKNAMHNPDLVRAMHAQLNPNFLQVDKPVYTQPVRVKLSTVYVAGTGDEWKAFFRTDITDQVSLAKRNLIPLDKAMREASLVRAMRAQLSPSLLNDDKELYIAPVRYNHSIVFVAGKYIEWKKFFSIVPKAEAFKN